MEGGTARGIEVGLDPGWAAVRLPLSDSGLGVGTINLVAGLGSYAVPAAVLAGPGVLLLLWVALQTMGAAAWIPAVGRLRGRDEPVGRP